jgi:hypothetical protein
LGFDWVPVRLSSSMHTACNSSYWDFVDIHMGWKERNTL